MKRMMKPVHPGTILREDILKEMNLSITKVAQGLEISKKQLSEIVNKTASISAEMAVRLEQGFGYFTCANKRDWMTKLNELKTHLKRGQVYRRVDLTKWSKSVDRHLELLVRDGTLRKLSQGLYHFSKETAFGPAPPEEESLVRGFLKDDRFLLMSLNAYNSLQVGTTQLYNERIVYNHKRYGEFKLGNKKFSRLY